MVINLALQIGRGHVRFKYPIYKTMVKVFEVCKHKMGPFLWLYLNTILGSTKYLYYIHSIYKKYPGRTIMDFLQRVLAFFSLMVFWFRNMAEIE